MNELKENRFPKVDGNFSIMVNPSYWESIEFLCQHKNSSLNCLSSIFTKNIFIFDELEFSGNFSFNHKV